LEREQQQLEKEQQQLGKERQLEREKQLEQQPQERQVPLVHMHIVEQRTEVEYSCLGKRTHLEHLPEASSNQYLQ